MTAIDIFAIVFVIGLIGSIYTYAQPSANNWQVVFVLMLIIGAAGVLIILLISLVTGE